MTDETFAAEDTIFAQFESERLRDCLETCAAGLGKKIIWGRPGYPDLLAIPAFVVVIDQSVVDSKTYGDYLKLVGECNDPAGEPMGDEDSRVHQTVIIVDDPGELEIPRTPAVLHLDQRNPFLGEWMQAILALSASTFVRQQAHSDWPSRDVTEPAS